MEDGKGVPDSGSFEANTVLASNVPVGMASPDQAVADFFYGFCQQEDYFFKEGYVVPQNLKAHNKDLSFLSPELHKFIHTDKEALPMRITHIHPQSISQEEGSQRLVQSVKSIMVTIMEGRSRPIVK